jgi:hypothetical protein
MNKLNLSTRPLITGPHTCPEPVEGLLTELFAWPTTAFVIGQIVALNLHKIQTKTCPRNYTGTWCN